MDLDRDAIMRQMREEAEQRRAEQANDPTVRRLVELLDADDVEYEELLESFPAEERDKVARLLYRDADGRLRTRHGLLS